MKPTIEYKNIEQVLAEAERYSPVGEVKICRCETCEGCGLVFDRHLTHYLCPHCAGAGWYFEITEKPPAKPVDIKITVEIK